MMSTRAKRWLRPLLAGLAVVSMTACVPNLTPTPVALAPAAQATSAPTIAPVIEARVGAPSPEEAVRSYYEWYLEYSRLSDGGEFKNPLVDEAYASSPYLTAELVERVGSIVASFDRGGYDPFLCAQDVPTAFTVSRAEGDGTRAHARVYTTFVGHAFDTSLVKGEGGWLLDEVTCANPDAAARTPEEVVSDFYGWYVHYPGNPLADQVHQGAGLFLTRGFIDEVAATVASFDKGGFDPILLAQDVPETITAERAVIDGDTATVVVSSSFEGHVFTVRTVKDGTLWKIDGVTPGDTGL